MQHSLLVMQVTGLTGLESSELRNKVGTSIADNTIVYLSGINIDPTPALRIAGMLPASVMAQFVLPY